MAEGGQGAAALLCPAARRAAASPAAAAEAEPHRLRPPPFLWQPVRPAPTCPGAAAAMRAASGKQPATAAAEEAGSRIRGEAAGDGQPCEARRSPGKKFVYVEPPRRVKEILEEELYFRKEACHVKHPAAVALEGIWSLKKNFSIRSLKPVSQNRNGLLLQPQLYSRHAGMKSKSQ
uniref:Chromosome 11 open reading frame 97 n=1 Tax=Accipiter nisus TaxID=211598 RepID=A0A8B9MV72_9AVES